MATAAEPKKPQVSVWTLLERRYATEQGWLLFHEVANRTGFASGYADAMALSVWPSRGIELHGFEIKHSRSDLLTELKDENKAAKFMKFCHHWWLVVSNAKFADGVEVPKTWGILAPRNGALYQVRAAPELEAEAWTPEFIASLMRRFHEAHVKKDADAIKQLVEERAEAMAQQIAKQREASPKDRWQREAETLRRRLEEFERKSGIDTSRSWEAGDIGEMVTMLLAARRDKQLQHHLQRGLEAAERIAKSLRGALKNAEQMEASLTE